MNEHTEEWLAEIDRRAAVYDQIGEGGKGRMTAIDYLGIAALTLALAAVFWMWGT
ncbi:hypothetical protein [Leisingera sp.]|uniref:hypothetical protein n=1 Tax=Leisingera sp. TaxID=1879318 RepID=UPI002B268A26|nr:hypothetical protein [Leisingera sp.]